MSIRKLLGSLSLDANGLEDVDEFWNACENLTFPLQLPKSLKSSSELLAQLDELDDLSSSSSISDDEDELSIDSAVDQKNDSLLNNSTQSSKHSDTPSTFSAISNLSASRRNSNASNKSKFSSASTVASGMEAEEGDEVDSPAVTQATITPESSKLSSTRSKSSVGSRNSSRGSRSGSRGADDSGVRNQNTSSSAAGSGTGGSKSFGLTPADTRDADSSYFDGDNDEDKDGESEPEFPENAHSDDETAAVAARLLRTPNAEKSGYLASSSSKKSSRHTGGSSTIDTAQSSISSRGYSRTYGNSGIRSSALSSATTSSKNTNTNTNANMNSNINTPSLSSIKRSGGSTGVVKSSTPGSVDSGFSRLASSAGKESSGRRVSFGENVEFSDSDAARAAASRSGIGSGGSGSGSGSGSSTPLSKASSRRLSMDSVAKSTDGSKERVEDVGENGGDRDDESGAMSDFDDLDDGGDELPMDDAEESAADGEDGRHDKEGDPRERDEAEEGEEQDEDGSGDEQQEDSTAGNRTPLSENSSLSKKSNSRLSTPKSSASKSTQSSRKSGKSSNLSSASGKSTGRGKGEGDGSVRSGRSSVSSNAAGSKSHRSSSGRDLSLASAVGTPVIEETGVDGGRDRRGNYGGEAEDHMDADEAESTGKYKDNNSISTPAVIHRNSGASDMSTPATHRSAFSMGSTPGSDEFTRGQVFADESFLTVDGEREEEVLHGEEMEEGDMDTTLNTTINSRGSKSGLNESSEFIDNTLLDTISENNEKYRGGKLQLKKLIAEKQKNGAGSKSQFKSTGKGKGSSSDSGRGEDSATQHARSYRDSYAGAEDNEEEEEEEYDSRDPGVRRSRRATKGVRLEYWKSERPMYDGGTIVGVLTADPTPVKKRKHQQAMLGGTRKGKGAAAAAIKGAGGVKRSRIQEENGHGGLTDGSFSDSTGTDQNGLSAGSSEGSSAAGGRKGVSEGVRFGVRLPEFEHKDLPSDLRYLKRRDAERMEVWDDLEEEVTSMKVVCHAESLLPASALPTTAKRPKGKDKVGFAAHSFNVQEIPGVMSGWISGFVDLPPEAIKDAEGVGKYAQVFFVSDCQDGALELGIADPNMDVWDNKKAQRQFLKKGDNFFVPPGNIYRLENHSKLQSCMLFWNIIKPMEQLAAEAAADSGQSDDEDREGKGEVATEGWEQEKGLVEEQEQDQEGEREKEGEEEEEEGV